MKHTLLFFFTIFGTLLLSFSAWANAPDTRYLSCLIKAYPILKIGSDNNSVVFPDGTSFVFDDGVPIDLNRDFDKLLANAKTLLSMFLIPYPPVYDHVPLRNEDPGRIRFEQFFRKLYGNNPQDVQKSLVNVRWVDNTQQSFNSKFGAASALQLVTQELKALVQAKPKMLQYLKSPLGGTYEWRPIAGTSNLSTHSFGIAIDINTDKTDYWRWDDSTGNNVHYKNRIPLEIAEIFEKHGFIWGGKWYHYDTMHFEFRPELRLKPEDCALGN